MSKKQQALFDDRFLESFAGKEITTNHKVALIELIANSWDAAATEVEIKWPLGNGELFSVKDNGHGMTKNQFEKRFRTLAYNRIAVQGIYAEIPQDHKKFIGQRSVFGRNGKGRLAGFAFGDFFKVKTWRDNIYVQYKVFTDATNILAVQELKSGNEKGHGTEISINHAYLPNITLEDIKTEISMRFMTDPNFKVKINDQTISFIDIPKENVTELSVNIPEIGEIKILVIDVKDTDKTTHRHGIAWHVKDRLVGECTWKGSGSEYLIDGRRVAAKRYIFIVKADCLEKAVLPDWTGFIYSDENYKKVFPLVQNRIKEHIIELNKENREAIFRDIEGKTKPILNNIGLLSREKWVNFITGVQEECPSISDIDLEKIAKLLAKLEQSESKYSLINLLASATSEELDDLNSVLKKWDINFAKIVLDEIEYRMKLLAKLKIRVLNSNTDEVHELQPLFHRGLWIFGPEYETIEYTSNNGMTKVIQDLFGSEKKGSLNRPDFAILKDSSVGLYSYPTYDEEGGDIGIDKLTIVELKKPGVPIGTEEVNQPWGYVNELLKKGLLKDDSRVMCFVLGSELKPYEAERTTKRNGKVIIQPLDYDTVIRRAKSRLLKLSDKVKGAPFLEEAKIKEFLREKEENGLF